MEDETSVALAHYRKRRWTNNICSPSWPFHQHQYLRSNRNNTVINIMLSLAHTHFVTWKRAVGWTL